MRKKFKTIALIIIVSLIYSCTHQGEKTNNLIKVPNNISEDSIAKLAARITPHPRQLKWQENEFIAFIHFGINTFTGREWGTGKEDPKIFNPKDLDVNQWVKVIKKAGMKLAMITVKHHDGFCLWQSKYTEHSVKNSKWENGNGDVLKELAEACRKESIKLGLYLSPADLHEIERENGYYGNKSKEKETVIPTNAPDKNPQLTYKLNDYDKYFMNQLYELLTEYGEIHEVWFDGANPKPGTGQTYNRTAWYDLIRKLQPQAVIAIKGPDVRWCGNEAGHTRKSEWSVIPLPKPPEKYEWNGLTEEDLGSRKKLKEAKYLYWYPAETNTSIRHGWFYRDENQYVKTTDELINTWFRSVGGNTVFLLNLTPNRDGLIPDKDAENLIELGDYIKKTFSKNIAEDAQIKASSEQDGNTAQNILDKNTETYWLPASEDKQASLTIEWKEEKEFNCISFGECIKYKGQRIEKLILEMWKDKKWEKISEASTVGFRRILRFTNVKTNKIRLTITASRLEPSIAFLGVYKAAERFTPPIINRNKAGIVSIKQQNPGPAIYYTTDGTEPNQNSTKYTEPFELPKGGTVKAKTYNSDFSKSSVVSKKYFGLCKKGWTIVSVDNQDDNFKAEFAIDENPNTFWHTKYKGEISKQPHNIQIKLEKETEISGFSYLPRKISTGGIVKKYDFFVSLDGIKWQEVIKNGTFDNIENNPMEQFVYFNKNIKALYFKFVSKETVKNTEWTSVPEIGIMNKKTEDEL